jgi:hypothetical protein
MSAQLQLIHNTYYAFDSHRRNEIRILTPEGIGILLVLDTLVELVTYDKALANYLALCHQNATCCFELIPVKVRQLFAVDNDSSSSSELNTMSDGEYACLHINNNRFERIFLHLSDDMSDFDSNTKQLFR